MTTILSQCAVCKHLDRSKPGEFKCSAFPTGISDQIVFNKIDHRKPIDGDRGIRWAPDEKGTSHPLGETE